MPLLRIGVATAIALATLGLAACTGKIGDDSGQIGGPGGGGPGGGTGTGTGTGTGSGPLADSLVDSTRFARLTHAQWENAVRDLLQLGAPPGNSTGFTTDPPGSTFGNDGNLLKVTPGLWGDYQKAAEDIADRVTKDSAQLAKITAGAAGTGDAQALAWLAPFLERAYRREVTTAEVDAQLVLFKRGIELTGMADPFAAGVNVVVQEVLQSPYFVYRVELGERQEDGTLKLGKFELASKLAFSLWNTMPDGALFAAAKSGALDTPEGVEKEARRLLDDPRAEPAIADFHGKLFQLDHLEGLSKDATRFAEWDPSFGGMMRKEAELFMRDVTVTQGKGLTELLTGNYTFVNDKLAPLYGLTGTFGSDYKKTQLDPTQRAGILTQVGFLAANASPRDTDPIHRGVFVNLKVICADLPPPPMNIPVLPKDETGTMTMRERITLHTADAACKGCHATMINPAGFAFEQYDALGKWRTTDSTKPVDAKASYPFEDGTFEYDGGVAFSKVLAARPQVHRCYTGNWLEYAFGRQKADGDAARIDRVSQASLAGGSTKEIVLKLVMEKAFTHRPAPTTDGAPAGGS